MIERHGWPCGCWESHVVGEPIGRWDSRETAELLGHFCLGFIGPRPRNCQHPYANDAVSA